MKNLKDPIEYYLRHIEKCKTNSQHRLLCLLSEENAMTLRKASSKKTTDNRRKI